MKKLLSVWITICLLLLLVIPGSAQTNSVSFGIRFDKQTYGVGDIVVATVYVEGLTDETVLGGLGTNLSFSSEDMTYVSGTLAPAINDAAMQEASVGYQTQSGKEIIYILVLAGDGLNASVLYNLETHTYDVATFTFTVNNPTDGNISLAYEEQSVPGALPYKTEVFDSEDVRFGFTLCSPVTAPVEDVLLDAATAVQGEGVITSAPVIYAAAPVTVIGKLHNADSGELIAAPVFKTVNTVGRSELAFSFNYTGNTENVRVTYYFWGIGIGLMNPRTAPITISVNA